MSWTLIHKNGLKLDLHFYPPSVNFPFYFIARLLSLWLSGLIRFMSHSTCWAYLAGDLQRPGIKSGSRHELSVGWTNGRYAMILISRTGTVCTDRGSACVLSKLWQVLHLKLRHYGGIQMRIFIRTWRSANKSLPDFAERWTVNRADNLP